MLRFCDGFDSYQATADLAQKWEDFQSDHEYRQGHKTHRYLLGDWQWNATEGVNGGGCVKHVSSRIGDRLGRSVRRFYHNPANMCIRDMLWFKIAEPPAVDREFLVWMIEDFRDQGRWRSKTNSIDLRIKSTGFLEQWNQKNNNPDADATGTATVVYTGAVNVCDNQWHCLERFILLGQGTNTTGTNLGDLRIAIDGADIVNVTAIDLTIANTKRPNHFYIASLGVDMWLDDIIVWDDAGTIDDPSPIIGDTRAYEHDYWTAESDINNFPEIGFDGFSGWMGPKQITTLRPNADGSTSLFDVEGAASAYEAVNTVTEDKTSYVESNVIGNRVLFTLEDFPHAALPIKTVVLNTKAVIPDHGSSIAQPESRNGIDFLLGWRKRIYGQFQRVPDWDEPNLIPNPGDPFVDNTGWTSVNGSVLSIVNGYLRIEHISNADYFIAGGAQITITVEPGERYRIYGRAGFEIGGNTEIYRPAEVSVWTLAGALVMSGASGSGFGVLFQTVGMGAVAEWFFTVPEGITQVNVRVETDLGGPGNKYAQLRHIAVRKEKVVHDSKLHQWAMELDPVTDTAWTQASLNAAEFGLRISQ